MVELIVTAINVFILFFLIGYLVSDMLSGMLTKRQERIADDINTARMSKEEALALKNDYEHRLADFESERADILENTRRKAAQMEERILLDGQQEADRVIARAKREAELKKTKLKEDVRHDMIMAASITACKLAAETLDDKKQAVYIQEMLDEFQKDFDNIRIKTLLSGEYDSENAIIKLNAGAGGTEACDWCGMLYRMYSRWADKKGFTLEVLDYLDGDEAGIKSVTFQVNGTNAYGYLKSEKGVHRLVRISPFDSNARRHTSFASVWVYPVIDDEINIEINESDCRIDTYRASGAGGQHINKTDSAVRITHIPTGIVVSCQTQRSQFQNRDAAWKMLKARLYDIELQKREAEAQGIRDSQGDNGWGNQIRSYVLQPYKMVKDLRTEAETSDTKAVLDGDIDLFLSAALASKVGAK